MKNIYKAGMMVVAGLVLATTSCSDFADYNSVPEDAQANSNQTLWQNISENSQLKDFAAIIQKAGYANVLNTPNYYTVWAPLDGTYDAQALMAKDSATIVSQFLNQHMAEYSHLVAAGNQERIVSLNDKIHNFDYDNFDGKKISTANVASSNGVLHLLDGYSQYYANLYQNIDGLQNCDNFKNYIQQYDEYYLDRDASVVGPMVNGQQTYLDSVFKKRNTVVDKIMNANLENEDSTYTMFIPTDAAWTAAYENVSKDYNYINKLTYMDMSKNGMAAALCKANTAQCDTPVELDAEQRNDSLTKNFLVRNLVFSNTNEYNLPLLTGETSAAKKDTLVSTNNGKFTNISDFLNHTVGEAQVNSNGYSRIVDTWCYLPWESYEPVQHFRTPVRTLGLGTGKNYSTHNVIKTSLATRDTLFEKVPSFIKKWLLPEDSQFFTYVSTDKENFASSSAKPELDFALKGLRSTKYHIYVVTVPAQLNDPEEVALKPTYLRFDISYTDAEGTQQYKRLNVPGAKASADIIAEPGIVNVIELEFDMPICYYGLDAYPTLFVSHTKSFTTSSNRNKYDQELRIAGLYFVPETADNYMKNNNE